jgi:hypothetical protein
VISVAVAALTMGFTTSAFAMATIYVVHGIPEAVVDVQLDGQCVLESAMFTDQAGPMDVAAGLHQVTVRVADPMDPCTGDILLDVPFLLEDGENVTAVAFLDEMCQPTAAKFANHLTGTEPGKARVVLHHTACAPSIDIAVSREMDDPFTMTVEGFENGEQVVEQLRPGDWYVTLFEAGSSEPAVGPTLVHLKPFMTYRVYAIGSIMHGNATVVAFEDRTK